MSSLRLTLARSNIGAVAVAVLLVWSLDTAFRALWIPVSNLLEFAARGIAIFDIPYFSGIFKGALELAVFGNYAVSAVIDFVAAYLVARWIYGTGPLRCLVASGAQLTRRTDV